MTKRSPKQVYLADPAASVRMRNTGRSPRAAGADAAFGLASSFGAEAAAAAAAASRTECDTMALLLATAGAEGEGEGARLPSREEGTEEVEGAPPPPTPPTCSV